MGRFDHVANAMLASPIAQDLARMVESQDYSRLDKNSAKRHHFLPQFMLRGFSHSHRGQDCVFQMEVTSRRAPRRMPVRTAASRHRLYQAIDESGQRSNRHEGYLALVEKHAAPVLRSLADGGDLLQPGERATVAFFVALQTMRTPAAAQQITQVANAAMRSHAARIYSDRSAFEDRYRRQNDESASIEDIERARLDILNAIRSGEVRITGETGAAFATAFRQAINNVSVLINCDWTLLRSPNGGFITSDRAYAVHDPTPPFPFVAQNILSSDHSESTVPLSDTMCLLICPTPMEGALTVRDISRQDVETINLRTLGWAHEHVFAKHQSALDAVRVASRRRPSDVVRPRPFTQVFLVEPDPDDDSLIKENLRRGWPRQLPNEQDQLCDYIVIPTDRPYPELQRRADELAESRARKRLRLGPDEPLDGQLVNAPVHP